MNFRLTRDQIVLLETRQIYESAGVKQTIFSRSVFLFWVGRYNETLDEWPKQSVLFPLNLNVVSASPHSLGVFHLQKLSENFHCKVCVPFVISPILCRFTKRPDALINCSAVFSNTSFFVTFPPNKCLLSAYGIMRRLTSVSSRLSWFTVVETSLGRLKDRERHGTGDKDEKSVNGTQFPLGSFHRENGTTSSGGIPFFSGNFPVERTEKSCSIYNPTGISRIFW